MRLYSTSSKSLRTRTTIYQNNLISKSERFRKLHKTIDNAELYYVSMVSIAYSLKCISRYRVRL